MKTKEIDENPGRFEPEKIKKPLTSWKIVEKYKEDNDEEES